ncbi:O-methyltransferase [Mumia zhuanghuii]|uniref:Class I SAM-dependent methyltransferase n=1 Tax=Mumia zhuanghuii TaxID=2585211 RepID=A0A5C4MU32_9ACTN|nr:class I SAM-dependent methyltransferase [Mumia zhuanghuii]TNC48902.1 class I SAM-dependent methyltransferase [Mumia zhuanghuii]TNC49221.1 class I SAM-dependent methyltransferase [Mumia zhuanghuii]
MKNQRRAALLTSAVAAAVSIVAALTTTYALAVAAIGLAWIAGLAWAFLWARTVTADLRRIDRQTRRRRDDAAGRTTAATSATLATHSERLDQLSRDLYGVLVTVQRTPSLTVELDRLYDRTVDHGRPMPELGDWALTPSTLIWMLEQVATTPVRTILECGSGSSTIWFATALERRGGEGHVTALETSAEYAERTRRELERLGLAHRATVVDAPLVPTALSGRADQRWFDLTGLPELPPVDLLFVDGPIGGTGHEARYPAFPLLADRLAPGAVVVLDDTGRPDEARIVKHWSAEEHAGRRLRQIERLDRSVAFRSEPTT